MVAMTMARGCDIDSKRYGDGNAGDDSVTPMVLMVVPTMTTMPDHSLPRHHTHVRTHTRTHAPHSVNATHTPRVLMKWALVRASDTRPC